MDWFAEIFDPKSIQHEDAAMNIQPQSKTRKEPMRFPEAVANVQKLINTTSVQLEENGEHKKAQELRLSWRRILQG